MDATAGEAGYPLMVVRFAFGPMLYILIGHRAGEYHVRRHGEHIA